MPKLPMEPATAAPAVTAELEVERVAVAEVVPLLRAVVWAAVVVA